MGNIQSFQEFFIGIFDKIAYPLTFLILAVSGYNLYEIGYPSSEMNNKFGEIRREVAEVRGSFYHNNMYNILKQGEKFRKDPKDIKQYDMAKFQRMCTDKKFVKYIKEGPGEPFLTDVKNTCNQIADIRTKSYKEEVNSLYLVKKAKQ